MKIWKRIYCYKDGLNAYELYFWPKIDNINPYYLRTRDYDIKIVSRGSNCKKRFNARNDPLPFINQVLTNVDYNARLLGYLLLFYQRQIIREIHYWEREALYDHAGSRLIYIHYARISAPVTKWASIIAPVALITKSIFKFARLYYNRFLFSVARSIITQVIFIARLIDPFDRVSEDGIIFES